MCENKEMERISFVILISTLMLASLSIVPAHAAEHPTIIAASVTSATEIVLTYSENIDANSMDGAGFALSVGQVSANTDPGGSADTITLTVSGITTSDRPDIIYTSLPDSLLGTAFNLAADQTFTGTTDDAPPIVFSIATSNMSAIDIVLSENVTINDAAPEDFVLSSTISTDPAVTGITAVTNNTVALALDDTLDSNDAILLAYTKTTGSIDDIPLPPLDGSFPVGLQDSEPTGLAFSNDGTRMFVVGTGSGDNDAVNQYALTTAFDVSTASFVDSFPVASQDGIPRGLAFSADGTKMFVVGDAGNDINEYTLSAAFDVSTASFVDSFPVASQDTAPRGLAFSTDGTKMFVVGDAGNDINEYTLTTPFDVSTASFVDSFPVASQDIFPRGLALSADGTKMFVVGGFDDDINEYTLTTPFDVSTASFVDSFPVRSQDTAPADLAFSADGTRIFVLGNSGENVHQYALSEPFTLFQQPNSLASFAAMSVTNNIPSDTTPPTITAATVTSLTEIVLTYSENIDVTTINGAGFTLSTGTVSANTDPAGSGNTITLTVSGITESDAPNVIYTESDGSVTDGASNPAEDQTFTGTTPLPDTVPPEITAAAVTSAISIVLTYSENIDVTTTDGTGFTLSVGEVTGNSDPAGAADTITLTVSGITNTSDRPDITYSAESGTVTDTASTSAASQTFTGTTDDAPPTVSSIATASTSTINIVLSENVTINGAAPEDFALSGTISTDPAVTGITAVTNNTVALALDDTLDSNDAISLAYTRNTGSIDDIPLPPLLSSFPVDLQDSESTGMAFSNDGTRMFVVSTGISSDNDAVHQYTLSAAFDVSTATFVDSFSVASQDTVPRGLAFSADGTKMFVVGSFDNNINEYALTTPFDVSTATSANSFSVSSQDTLPADLAFSGDGTRMFVIGDLSGAVYEYTLTAPFDVSNVAGTSDVTFVDSFSVASEDILPRGLAFSGDGTKMFVVGGYNGAVYEYALTAPFDVSTATSANSFSVSSQDQSPTGLAFSADGTRIFVLGDNSKNVHQYALSEPFTLFQQPNSLASFAAMLVTNNIPSDTAPPTITAAAVTSLTEIVLTYSENIDVTTTNGEGFTLSVGGTVSANTDPDNSGNTITLTVSGITASDAPNVIYTESDGSVTDGASNPAASQTFTGTTPLPDTVPPEITAAAVTSLTEIVLTYSENVDVNTTDGAGFGLSDGGAVTANTDPAGSDDTITLTVSGITDTSYTPSITYDDSLGTVEDSASNQAADQTFDRTVDNAPPTVSSVGTVGTSTIHVILSENVTVSSAAPGDFVLSGTIFANPVVTGIINAAAVATPTNTLIPTLCFATPECDNIINPVATPTNTLILTLSGTLDDDDDINLAYTRNTGSIDDISTASASFVDSFSVDSEGLAPSGLAFSNDGTKMFVLSDGDDAVYEYTLAAPFDVSSATYAAPFSVPQDTLPVDLAFSGDGKKMFVLDDDSQNVYEYALTAPFDLSAATSAGFFSVTSQVTAPSGLAFSANGTKMFVVDASDYAVSEYALTAPFDLSTATSAGSFPVSSEDIFPRGLAFSNDGTRMFVLDNFNSKLNEYALTAPFDISNVTSANSFSVSSQDAFPSGLAFSGDGTKMFVSGDDGVDINEYTLPEPFTLSTQPNSLASFVATPVANNIPPDTDAPAITAAAVTSATSIVLTYSENVDVNTTDGAGFGLSDGGAVTANTDPEGSDDTITLTVSGITNTSDTPNVTYIESDGTVEDSASNQAADQTFDRTVDDAPPTVSSIETSSTSTINVVLSENVTVSSVAPGDFALSGTISTNPTVTGITPILADTVTLALSDTLDNNDDINLAYAKTTGSIDDILLSFFASSFSVAPQGTDLSGLAFSADGKKMFVLDLDRDAVNEYALSTPFDVSNVTLVNTFSVGSQDTLPQGLAFSGDGTRMFVLGDEGNDVNEYILAAPFDISNVIFVDSFSVDSQDVFPSGLAFSNNGTKMFVVGDLGDAVNEYALTAPFDVSTSSFVGSFSVASEDTLPLDLAFSGDGTRMFVVGNFNDAVNEYTLAAPFDVSNVTLANSFPVASQDRSPSGLAFSGNGTRMFVLGDFNDDINEYVLPKPFNLLPQPNSLASFAADPVKNNIPPDTVAPTITAAAVTSTTSIVLTYSENVDVSATDGAGFDLSDGGAVTANTDPEGSDDTITLTVSGITNTSDTPDVTYIESDGTVADGASNQAEDQTFDRTVDDAPPTVSSIETSSASTIDVVLSEDVEINGAAPEDFALSGTISTNLVVTGITAAADTVTLALSDMLDSNDDINLTYAKDTGSIDDILALTSFTNSLSVASQGTYPSGLAFSNNGTKMFVLDLSGNAVNEYTLTAPFDISDATLANSISVASQDRFPSGLAFSGDGTRMFVVGDSNSKVNEYALSTPFDISNATLANSISVASQDAFPSGLAFSDDGKKMFVVGTGSGKVNEYVLIVPFDISTATFDSSFSVASQDAFPLGLAFSGDGTRMFVVGLIGDDVNEYALASPFDVSTAAPVSSFSVASEDENPQGLAFSGDGTRMFVVGNDGDDINEYTLSKPFTLFPQPNSLASFAADSVINNIPPDTTPPTITAAAVTFLTEILLTYSENIDVTTTNGQGFTLSVGQVTANTDPAGSDNTITLTVSNITISDAPNVIYTESDGTVTDRASNPAANQTFAGTTASTMLIVSSIGTASTLAIDIVLSEDVTINDAAPGDFALSGTISTDPAVIGITAVADTVTLTLNDTLDSNDVINLAYNRTTGSIDNISAPPSFVDSFSVVLRDQSPLGLAFSANGTKMFVVGKDQNMIHEYTLTAPFDVSTATFANFFPVASQDTRPQGLAFSNDGTKMFVVGDLGGAVYEYTLSTPFDVSTATFDSSFPVTSQDIKPRGLAFSADGTRMFVTGNNDIAVYGYTLTAPFDVSTATFDSSFPVNSQDTRPWGLDFSNDGKKMFVIGLSGKDVNEYALSAPFDVSTSSFTSSFPVTSQDTKPRGLAFSADGKKMFVVGNDDSDVNEYTLSKPFTLLPQPNSLASFAAMSVKNNIASTPPPDDIDPPIDDTTPPTIIAAAVISLTEIVLTYSENIDVITTNGEGFTLSTGTVTANTDPAGSGNTITLTVSGITAASDAPNVIYTESDGSVTDSASNPAEDQTFTGTTPLPDTVPPEITAAAVTSAISIVLTYSENIDVSTTNGAGFALSDGEVTANTDPAGSDDTITLTVSGITASDAPNVIYTESDGNVEDSASNPAEDQTFTGTTAPPDTIPPTIIAAAVISLTEIVLTYSENIDVSATNGQGFALSTGGTVTANTDPAGSDDTITLTVSGITDTSDTPSITYDDSLGTVTDAESNQAEDQTFDRTVDDAPPTVSFIGTVGTSTIHVVLSEDVTVNGAAPGDFALSGTISTDPIVTGVTPILADTVILALSDTLDDDDDINLAYTKTTGSIDDISAASASFVDSFSVDSENIFPRGLAFSNNGTKMFVLSDGDDAVYEYALTAPFDVSSATYAGPFSVPQDTIPVDLAFSGDGTKMFVLGDYSQNVSEYALAAPFDLSAAISVGSFSVASQVTAPSGLAFSDNGTRMFVVDASDYAVSEYTLTVPFTVSTLSFVGSFSVASQDTSPQYLTFSNDGTRMFVLDSLGQNVSEYILASPFDVSDATFANSFSVSSQDTFPTGLAFSDDGTKMFVSGDDGVDINEYTLPEPFTLSTQPNSLASFDARSVTNNIPPDTDAPTITAAAMTSATSITLTYSENVDVSATNGTGFGLSDGGAVTANTDPEGSDDTITLTVSGITNTSDRPDVTYTKSDGSVTDSALNLAEDQTFDRTVDDAPPTVSSIEISSASTIDVVLSENVIVNDAAPGDFALSGTISTNPTVTGITPILADTVTLALSDTLDNNDVIHLAYAKTTGSIDDILLPSFANSFSVASQGTYPSDLAFSNDGTRMFVLDSRGQNVHEYALTAPFDISDASFVDSFPVSSQDTFPQGLAFSGDGTRMFVLGDDVNEYILASPFDISNATFVDSFSVASQDIFPSGLAFSGDGTRMFVLGDFGDDVNEYALTAPFDVSTSSFANSFSVSSQDTFPSGLAFSGDGTRMFVIGDLGNDVNEYALTAPFDISNAAFVGSFPVDSQDRSPSGLAFSGDGTRMFVLGDFNDDINEYVLPKPFNLLPQPNSLASFVAVLVTNNIPPDTDAPTITAAAMTSATSITLTYSENVDVSATNGTGFGLSDGGAVTANTDPEGSDDTITLTVSGITNTSDRPDVTYIASDGTVADGASNQAEDQTFDRTVDDAPPTVSSIETSSASTIDVVLSENVTVSSVAPGDFALSGTISTNPTVTGITPILADTVTLALSDTLDNNDVIHLAYAKTTGSIDDILLPSFTNSFSVASQGTYPSDLAFSNDGTRMFVTDSITATAYEYELSAPFDVSTSSFANSFLLYFDDMLPSGLAFSDDGTKMFAVGDGDDAVYEYALTTPFDLSTADIRRFISVSSQVTFPSGLAFSDDGTRMFVLDLKSDAVYEYTLAISFDISNVSFTNSFPVSSQDTFPQGLAFSNDGTRMFVTGNYNDAVYEYALTAPFDVSNVTYAGSFSVSQDTFPSGLAFSGDGIKMFVVGGADGDVNEYTLPKPFTLSTQPNSLASFDARLVTNNIAPSSDEIDPPIDTTPPEITAAAVTSATSITLTYSENIDVTTTDGQGFTLSTTGGTVTANTDPASSGNTITLTVSGITASDTPSITYDDSLGTVVDTASNPAASQTFAGTTALPDTIPPEITAAAVTSAISIVLTYSENIDVTTTNGAGFALSDGEVTANTDPAGSDDTITLTVSGITASDAPNVIYTESDGTVTDSASNPAASQTFTGTTAPPDTIPPEITAAAVTSAISIVLTYSENIDVTTTNGAGFALSDGEVTANTDPAGSDDTITLTVSGITASGISRHPMLHL